MCRCRNPMEGTCDDCRKIRENIHPDLLYVLGSGKTGAISIDSVRDMRRNALIAPNEAEKRVFVLEDCDNMLPAAQNAFLKIFEEAPPHAVFIMTCRSSMNLLDTIRSRGRIFSLSPVNVEEGASFIARTLRAGSEDAARNALISSGGNIGGALRILGSENASREAEKAASVADGILAAMCGDSGLSLAVSCAAIGKDRALGGSVCRLLIESLRCALMTSVGAEGILPQHDARLSRLGSTLSPDELMRRIDQINRLSEMLRINISMPLFNTRLAIILRRCEERI